jgi:predicted phosphodiesterase
LLKAKLSASSLSFISALPEHISLLMLIKKVTVVHGSYFNTSEFIFKSTVWEDIVANFKATDSDVIIAGHCGLPFNKTQDGLLWLNPGHASK